MQSLIEECGDCGLKKLRPNYGPDALALMQRVQSKNPGMVKCPMCQGKNFIYKQAKFKLVRAITTIFPMKASYETYLEWDYILQNPAKVHLDGIQIKGPVNSDE